MNATPELTRKDLVVLVADRNTEAVIVGLLERPQALKIYPITFDIFVHPRRDPGCLTGASDFLQPFSGVYHYALVLCDHQGCGRERSSPEVLADEVTARLDGVGWHNRAGAVVLAPELEVWAWTGSPHVARCLGWADRKPSLREWLAEAGYWRYEDPKPPQPKPALEAALRQVRKPRSSAIYGDLARSVTLKDHTEPAFLRLTRTLQKWFEEPTTRNP